MLKISRRSLLGGIATAVLARSATASQYPTMVVNKDPNCGCCSGWIEHIRASGFEARVIEAVDLQPVKTRLAVPRSLQACHTAEIGGYVIEGHVPAAAIKRLLAERPTALGLAVPGMPAGSPGMEVAGGRAETYDVMLFSKSGQKIYARFQGTHEMP